MFLTSLKLTHGGRCLQQAVGASSSGRARRGYRLHRPSCSYSPQQQGEPAAAAAADQGGAGCSGEPPAEAGKMPYGALLALSSVGLCETAYLTATKLLNVAVACPLAGGCADVLNSEYAKFMGVVPLPCLGMLAYGTVAALAVCGLRQQQQQAAAQQADTGDKGLRLILLTCGAVMASCSGYLMYILATQFDGDTCPWCIGSALLSFCIAGLAVSGMRRRELEEAAGQELGVVAATLLVLSLGLGNPGSSLAGDLVLEYKEPIITTDSSKEAVSLAQRLAKAGAKMYGAFWCSHCYDQKEDFGAQAMKDFPYVECFPEGWQKGVQMAPACQEAGLEGFPTWVIGGQRLMGEQTFEQLEEALTRAVEDVARAEVP